MDLKKYCDFSSTDFIMDNIFLKWAIHPDQKTSPFWKNFILENPHKRQQIQDAIFFIRVLRTVKPVIPQKESSRIKAGINDIPFKNMQQTSIYTEKVSFLNSTKSILYNNNVCQNDFLLKIIYTKTLKKKGRIIQLKHFTNLKQYKSRLRVQTLKSNSLN